MSLLLVATTYGAVVSFIAIYAGQQGITNIGIHIITVYKENAYPKERLASVINKVGIEKFKR
ncbi:nitrite/sulfite reductase ferredoxin-like protein [Desulfallas thermosapovorans DSM 6562]|uniref:Nitrite/sulfite reductase ferredoxin-like protein n=1 Tax=Desulfallas thermosapovorans DSM 6562 TaxID=1121431 RepID=A0A5S4ZXD5_9FIRM|nr:nitrite/sulfite reductase ferredoxin-like protein [Desulfallas thermosapovorans DSM 6562]